MLEQLGINPTVIVVNIIGFLLLVGLLKKFLYGPVTAMLDSRKQEIADTYDTAERERSNMEGLRQDYEKRLAGIEAEAKEKIQAAIKEAHGIRDEILADARTKSESILTKGEEELAREREKTVAELRADVADLVIGASSRLLEESLDDKAHRKLIDDFISSVGEAK
ncbi:MAG: F0F1 ATP synthase subunit B [Armatimonadota bacterium]